MTLFDESGIRHREWFQMRGNKQKIAVSLFLVVSSPEVAAVSFPSKLDQIVLLICEQNEL